MWTVLFFYAIQPTLVGFFAQFCRYLVLSCGLFGLGNLQNWKRADHCCASLLRPDLLDVNVLQLHATVAPLVHTALILQCERGLGSACDGEGGGFLPHIDFQVMWPPLFLCGTDNSPSSTAPPRSAATSSLPPPSQKTPSTGLHYKDAHKPPLYLFVCDYYCPHEHERSPVNSGFWCHLGSEFGREWAEIYETQDKGFR